MNLSQEKALYHVTGQLYPNAVTMVAIEQMVAQYPYFAPAQSLLAYHYKKEEHPMVVLQTLKTALYFANPYWLQFQIQDHSADAIKINPVTPTTVPLYPSGIPDTVESDESVEREPFKLPVLKLVPEHPEPEPELESIPAPIVDIQTETSHETPPEEPVVVAHPPEWVIGNSLFSKIDIPTVEAVKEILRKIDAADHPDEPKAEPEKEAILDMDETAASQPTPEELTATGFEPATDNKIASMLADQLTDFKKPLDPTDKLDIDNNTELLFTVDYFASQGIKVDLTSIPQDKLTVHLLKFTDWLRQVKQGELNPKDLLANSKMEQIVVMNAQISNEKGEIITEAMAEVLVKQGQIAHAILLYQKLSFLNPEKTSYFAAKIEQLKGI
jgi:hypothetical protein